MARKASKGAMAKPDTSEKNHNKKTKLEEGGRGGGSKGWEQKVTKSVPPLTKGGGQPAF